MKTLGILLTIIGTFLIPIKPFLLILGGFIFLDTIVGIYTSIKLGGLRAFKSTKLFNVVVKSFIYSGAVILLYSLDRYIIVSDLFGIKYLLSKAVTVLFCYIEAKSIDESQMKLGGRSIWIIFKETLGKFKDIKKDIKS